MSLLSGMFRPTPRARGLTLGTLAALLFCAAATPGQATPYHGRFVCKNTWTWVANQPSGYVIGNCPGGTGFVRSDKGAGDRGSYDGGFFPDLGLNGCAWIKSVNDMVADENDQPTACLPGTISKAPRDFLWVANCRPGVCRDGTQLTIPKGRSCAEVANVRPWGETLRPSGPMETRHGGYPWLKWRYVVGQNGKAKADADGTFWILVHDSQPDPPDGDGTNVWAFVPSTCLPNPLPRGRFRTYRP